MSLINLFIPEVKDEFIKENFIKLSDFFDRDAVLNTTFKHLELTYASDGTFLAAHTFSYAPKDVIQTSQKGTGAITYNYSAFTNTHISVTVSGSSSSDPLVVRLFVGTYNGTG